VESKWKHVEFRNKKRGVQNFVKSQCNDTDWWINHLIILYFPNDSHFVIDDLSHLRYQYYISLVCGSVCIVLSGHCSMPFDNLTHLSLDWPHTLFHSRLSTWNSVYVLTKCKQKLTLICIFTSQMLCKRPPLLQKKPIISPSWTDANSIISPGLVRLVISMVRGCMRSGYQACYQSYGSVLNNL